MKYLIISTSILLFYSLQVMGLENKSPKSPCVDEKQTLHQEFIEAYFDEGRTSVGKDQIEPIKEKIATFIREHHEMVITDIFVTVTSAKTPFYISDNGKKKLDPQSNERNLKIITDRAGFTEVVLNELKKSSSSYEKIKFSTKAELAGPDFSPMDLNGRFVTKMSPGYVEKLEVNFKKNQKLYTEQAFINDYQVLFDENKYVNLYQARFKPFHGFRIEMKGHLKVKMKCVNFTQTKESTDSTSKQ